MHRVLALGLAFGPRVPAGCTVPRPAALPETVVRTVPAEATGGDPAERTAARDINERGQIVGASNGRPAPRDGVAVRLAPRHRGGLAFRSARAWASLARLRATEGRKDDPLDRARRLLTKAHERLDMRGDTKLRGCSPPATPGRAPHGLARQGDRPEHLRHRRPPCRPETSSPSSASTSRTSRARPRCTPSAARCAACSHTSPRDTRPRSPTARPKRSTT
jgi:hypothetical protein